MEYFFYHKEGLLGKHNSVIYHVADRQSVIKLVTPDEIRGGSYVKSVVSQRLVE